MTVTERIIHLIELKNLKPSYVADSLGISRSNLTRWKQKEYIPSTEHIIALSEFFNVTTDWLLIGKDGTHRNASPNPPLTADEAELLKSYKRLSTPDQIRILERIKTVADVKEEMETQILEKTQQKKLRSKPVLEPIEALIEWKEQVEMQVFDLPASAGFGNYLDQDSTYELLSFDADEVPEQADYGIRIAGDSMEPDIANGSIVWVREQVQVENGQIGIFVLDGEAYCKKLNVDHKNRKMQLLSLNKKYPPKVISEYQELKTVGRVLI